MTEEISKSNANENDALEQFHYKQELKRNLKLFSSFAVAFSFISITTGVFSNYKFLLTTAGPCGIWSWLLTFAGQFLVALIYAELACAIPVSGYSYQWVKRLSTPMMGWVTGWLCTCFLILVVPAIDSGLAPVFASLLGIDASPANVSIIIISTLVIQAVLNIVGVKLASLINNAAVFTESIGTIILTLVLLAVAFSHGSNMNMLTSTGGTGAGVAYLKPFMMSMLMGAFCLVGFESAANLSEETVNAKKTVPKAIIGSILLSGFFGMILLIAVTLSIQDLPQVMASNNVLPLIIESSLGPVIGKIFLVIVSVSIFACGTVSMTSGARLIYAMSRDNAFFFSNIFKKISPKTASPIAATVLILVFAIYATVFSSSMTMLIGVTTCLPALIYLITIVSYAITRKNLKFKEGRFTLGRASKPVLIAAIIWLVLELLILTIPADFHINALITLVLIVLGFIIYALGFKTRLEGQESISIEAYNKAKA